MDLFHKFSLIWLIVIENKQNAIVIRRQNVIAIWPKVIVPYVRGPNRFWLDSNERNEYEPHFIFPNKIGPNAVRSNDFGPAAVWSNDIGPNAVRPNDIGPNTVASNVASSKTIDEQISNCNR